MLLVDLLTTTQPGTSALGSQETGTLEDGTFAYVRETKTLFILDKTATASVAGGMIRALNGGLWIPQTSIGGSYGSAAMRNTFGSDKSVTLTGGGVWKLLPSGGGTFASQYNGIGWGFNTTTGKLTWNGPSDQPFLFNAFASGYESITVADVAMTIIKNETTVSDAQAQATTPVASGSGSLFTMSVGGIIVLAQGDAIDLTVSGDASTLTLTKISLALTALH